jgi:large subunit ribosomal protein L9
MQVILHEDVEKLGARGQVVDVAEGYARNFLLPRKLAVAATASNMKAVERMRASFAKREATEKGDAQTLAGLLAGVTVRLTRKAGDTEQMFGSVTTADISESLAAQGYTIDKRKIQLDDPIKHIGDFDVPVRLHREVIATLKVIVEREG